MGLPREVMRAEPAHPADRARGRLVGNSVQSSRARRLMRVVGRNMQTDDPPPRLPTHVILIGIGTLLVFVVFLWLTGDWLWAGVLSLGAAALSGLLYKVSGRRSGSGDSMLTATPNAGSTRSRVAPLVLSLSVVAGLLAGVISFAALGGGHGTQVPVQVLFPWLLLLARVLPSVHLTGFLLIATAEFLIYAWVVGFCGAPGRLLRRSMIVLLAHCIGVALVISTS